MPLALCHDTPLCLLLPEENIFPVVELFLAWNSARRSSKDMAWVAATSSGWRVWLVAEKGRPSLSLILHRVMLKVVHAGR